MKPRFELQGTLDALAEITKAATRLIDLRMQEAALLKRFPQLEQLIAAMPKKGRPGRKSGRKAGRKKLSAAARKAMSEAAKRRWAEKRKAAQ